MAAVIEGECIRVDAAQRDPGRLVITPHPVLLDGQRNMVADLKEGETLGQFLARHIDLAADAWEVRIGGVLVPAEIWHMVKPKHGQVIEVRGAVRKQALYFIAMLALTYFTFGIGTAGGFIAGTYGAFAAAAVYVAGAVIINKVLAPKPPKPIEQGDGVYSLAAARNQPRQYEPVPLLFGETKITPDLASNPYAWFLGNDQYLGMVLNAGINVASVSELRNGDTLLSSYQDATAYYAGFSAMPEQPIPLYTNADSIAGGELDPGAWVQRATPLQTIRIQIDIDYVLGDMRANGDALNNSETVVAEYAPIGTGAWQTLGIRNLTNNNYDPKRLSIVADVAEGQYDVRVRRLGRAIEILRGKAEFTWTQMTAVQRDPATYAGLARIGVMVRASGQLSGALSELRCIAVARPHPIWNGSAWVTATSRSNGLSNPGAQILQYARGFYDQNGRLIAGIGLDDEQIDIEAFKGFMLHCAAQGFTYDAYIKEARSHEEVVNAIALAGMGQVTWASGRLSIAWVAQGQPIGGVVNMATIKKGQFQVDYTLANPADGIEFTYFDRTDWQPKTIRVAAPGVTVPLNPAQVQGEGVTTEAHAARLARWHMAQSLFQYKDVAYSTDLEHLSYRRLSVLALQHDLTQWGFGGRLRSASVGGTGDVSLLLDDAIPSPSVGNAYIGVRVPGESAYRVFGVQPFDGEVSGVYIVGGWPAGVPFPGDPGYPAEDYIWIYDFKQTPGLRVRVVGIEPESDLKGARVSVVPEGDEFWNYVINGTYTPPANQSLLPITPPVPAGLTATPIADAILLTWLASPVRDPVYVIERAPDENGVPGAWAEVARTTDLRFTSPEPTGMAAWFRIRALSLGRFSAYTPAVVAVPISSNPPTIEVPIVNGVAIVNCLYDQFTLNLTQDAAVSFINVPFVKTILIEIHQAGGFALTFPPSVIPVSGLPYQVTQAAGAVDVVGLMTNTQGQTWRLAAQQPNTGGGDLDPLTVTIAPSPAESSVTTDGVTATAPSVQVTATAAGAAGTAVHSWTRTDSLGGANYAISDPTSATPTFSIPAGTNAVSLSQQWTDNVSDDLLRQAQASVIVNLSRSVTGGSGALTGSWDGVSEMVMGIGMTGENGGVLSIEFLRDGTWRVWSVMITNNVTHEGYVTQAGYWHGTPSAAIGDLYEARIEAVSGIGGTLSNGAPDWSPMSTGRGMSWSWTRSQTGYDERVRSFRIRLRQTGQAATEVAGIVTFTIGSENG